MKRLSVLGIAMMMAVSASGYTNVPVFADSVMEENQKDTCRIDSVSTDQGDIYFYVPLQSKLLSVRTCTTPIFVVMENEKCDAASVEQRARETGLAELAEREGAVVAVISPKGDTWTAEDINTYNSIFSYYSDSSNNTYIDGKTEEGIYAGAQQRIYVFAEGAAADFAATHLSQKVECLMDYGAYQLNADLTPTCTVLFNTTVDLPTEKNYEYDIPMVVVNPADEEKTERALAALNLVNSDYLVTEGEFQAENTVKIYEDIVKKLRRQSGRILEIPDYEALGMHEDVVTRTLSTGDITCYQYLSEKIDQNAEGSVPLVLLFHGGGNQAQYEAWGSGWLDIALEDGMMVVSVDNHVDRTSADIIELLKLLEEEYPMIDTTHVYASGFSMGAVKCWNLATKYPEYFAGIMPCDAGYMAEENTTGGMDDEIEVEIKEITIPIYYVAGGKSFTNEAGGLNEQGKLNNVSRVLQRIFCMNQVTDDYTYDEDANITWGISPTETESVENLVFQDTLNISSFASQDGNIYTKLSFDVNKGHELYAQDAEEAWKFLKQFTRNSDGTISINE